MENGTNFIITGILNDVPGKSHLKFDAYASYSSVTQLERPECCLVNLTIGMPSIVAYTYILLKKGGASTSLQQALKGISNRIEPEK